MKLISILSVGVATAGMTCLVGYASAANTAPGDVIPDSMLLAQTETVAPGGRGGGTAGETGRADKGTPNAHTKQGAPGNITTPGKARPGTEKNTPPGGNTGSDSGRTGTSSGSPGSGSGPSSGAGSGAK